MIGEYACCKCGAESATIVCEGCMDSEDTERQWWHQIEMDNLYAEMVQTLGGE